MNFFYEALFDFVVDFVSNFFLDDLLLMVFDNLHFPTQLQDCLTEMLFDFFLAWGYNNNFLGCWWLWLLSDLLFQIYLECRKLLAKYLVGMDVLRLVNLKVQI